MFQKVCVITCTYPALCHVLFEWSLTQKKTLNINCSNQVHFRDSHDRIVSAGDFCVEDLMTDEEETNDPSTDSSDYNEDDYYADMEHLGLKMNSGFVIQNHCFCSR